MIIILLFEMFFVFFKFFLLCVKKLYKILYGIVKK